MRSSIVGSFELTKGNLHDEKASYFCNITFCLLTFLSPAVAQDAGQVQLPCNQQSSRPNACVIGPTIIRPNHFIQSPDGRFRLIFQNDGNLVVYRSQQAIWDTNTKIPSPTGGREPQYARFQQDGNFVVYHRLGSFQFPETDQQARWDSNTSRNPGSILALQNDGNLVIYNSQNRAIWDTNTCCR